MDEPNHTASEIAVWQQALREQRHIEEQLAAARATGGPKITELTSRVDYLRTRADLLLADVAKAQARRRDRDARATSPDIDLDAPSESFSAD